MGSRYRPAILFGFVATALCVYFLETQMVPENDANVAVRDRAPCPTTTTAEVTLRSVLYLLRLLHPLLHSHLAGRPSPDRTVHRPVAAASSGAGHRGHLPRFRDARLLHTERRRQLRVCRVGNRYPGIRGPGDICHRRCQSGLCMCLLY